MTAQAQQKVASRPVGGGANLLPALDQIFVETVALFQRLRAVAPLMHAHCELDHDECTVLQGLDRDGSRTVADIANDCSIQRSQAQKLVKALEKRELVEMVPNPVKKRAKLVAMTEKGQEMARSLDRREVELLSSLPLQTSAAELQAAAAALARVRQAFSDEEWRKLLNNGNGR